MNFEGKQVVTSYLTADKDGRLTTTIKPGVKLYKLQTDYLGKIYESHHEILTHVID